jgi:hypothetical protein
VRHRFFAGMIQGNAHHGAPARQSRNRISEYLTQRRKVRNVRIRRTHHEAAKDTKGKRFVGCAVRTVEFARAAQISKNSPLTTIPRAVLDTKTKATLCLKIDE